MISDLRLDGCDQAHDRAVTVTRAIRRMRTELARPLPLTDLARAVSFSPFHFHRVFREVTRMTPGRFCAALRMAEARRLLLHSQLTVSAISTQVGYASVGSFTTQFTRLVGLTPRRFRILSRLLVDVRVRTVIPLLDDDRGPTDRPLRPSIVNPRGLLAVQLAGPDGNWYPEEHWLLADGGKPLRLPAGPSPVFRRIRVFVLSPDTQINDVLVDHLPDRYLVGTATIASSTGSSPGSAPGSAPGSPIEVAMRRSLPTDPPVLSAMPLRRLADLLVRHPEVAPRRTCCSAHGAEGIHHAARSAS